jgi:hypothetical protein
MNTAEIRAPAPASRYRALQRESVDSAPRAVSMATSGRLMDAFTWDLLARRRGPAMELHQAGVTAVPACLRARCTSGSSTSARVGLPISRSS